MDKTTLNVREKTATLTNVTLRGWLEQLRIVQSICSSDDFYSIDENHCCFSYKSSDFFAANINITQWFKFSNQKYFCYNWWFAFFSPGIFNGTGPSWMRRGEFLHFDWDNDGHSGLIQTRLVRSIVDCSWWLTLSVKIISCAMYLLRY